MNDSVVEFIRVKHIDSFQKLRLVLFLHRHPHLTGTCQEFAAHLHLGNSILMERIIADLHRVGLVNCVEDRLKLNDNPDIDSCLEYLAQAFEDPLTRQGILNQIWARNSGQHHNNAQMVIRLTTS